MKHDSTDIRSIIRRFYEGTASPEEISRAVDYFNSTEVTDPSLSADRDIILALHSPGCEVKAPANLEQRLLDATVNRQKKKPRILPWILSVSASAAVVALIATIGYFGINNETATTPIPADIAELTDTMPVPEDIQEVEETDENAVSLEEPEPETTLAATQVNTSRSSAKVVAKKAKRKKARTVEQPQYTKKERAAAKLSIELINRVLGKADIACANAEEVFMEIDETLNE